MKEKLLRILSAIRNNPVLSGFFAMVGILFVTMLIQIRTMDMLSTVNTSVLTTTFAVVNGQQNPQPVRICDVDGDCLNIVSLKTYNGSTPLVLPVAAVQWTGR